MSTTRLLSTAALLFAAAFRAGAEDAQEPVFSSVPDPASVQVFVPPPTSVENMAMIGIDDPWEGFNRAMYGFNARFDRAVFIPVVDAYQFVMPDFAEQGVSNFFANLLEIRSFANNALQFRLKDTGVTGLRFVINSTIGVAGLWDPATRMGLHRRKEDFGQTLGRWGVASGPYLVLPLLGPSSLRDGGGFAIDAAMMSAIDPLQLSEDGDSAGPAIAVNTLQAIDTRSITEFRYYRTGSPFEYVLVRYAYTRMRQIEVER